MHYILLIFYDLNINILIIRLQGEFSQPSADRSQDEEENFPVQAATFGGREDCEEPDSGSAENKLNC